jgi:uncharacterized membrane protein
MIDDYARALTLAAAVGAGVAGGVFFAFSTFVMKALEDLPPADGIAAMQSINRHAPTPWFMTLLLGTAALCAALVVSAVIRWGEASAPYQLAGGLSYLAAIVLTIAYHVPRNDALARVDPGDGGAAAAWSRYLAEWVPWNHVRTLTSVAATVLFVLALRVDG